jgi:hypothetical protein
MRYNRVLVYHPIAGEIPDFHRRKLKPGRKRFPTGTPQALLNIAHDAIFDLVAPKSNINYLGCGYDLMDDRSAFREFFEFRQVVLNYSRKFLSSISWAVEKDWSRVKYVEPGSMRHNLDLIRFEASEKICCSEAQGEIYAHLNVLREIWFLPGINIADDDPLSFSVPVNDRARILTCHFSVMALMKCDEAVLARRAGRHDFAMEAAILAAQANRHASEFNGSITKAIMDAAAFDAVQSRIASRSAKKGYLNGEKYKAKKKVYELWLRWKNGEIVFKNNSKFALHVVTVFDVLESTGVVEKWQRDWRQGKDIPDV